VRVISPLVARRLAISCQRLAGSRPPGSADGILDLVRHLGCVQLDPTAVVAPSHRLVLWSRLGSYDTADLERLRWDTRQLFEYWAHAASIVPTQDYPIHAQTMRSYARGDSAWSRRFQRWIGENLALKRHVLRELRRRGPLPAGAFEDRSVQPWQSAGWTSGRNVERVLSYLWITGTAVVAGRQAGTRYWDLSKRWLPAWTPRDRLSEIQVVGQAAQRALRALGIARPIDIQRHFIRDRYPGLPGILKRLQADGTILPVSVVDRSGTWPGTWFIHAQDVPLLDRIEAGDWQPRTALLSPFDNLICDRQRTRLMFDFDFSIEIYVPADRRRYGYYVLPILHGDHFIGRIDAAVDRKRNDFSLRAIHSENGSANRDSGAAAAATVADLATYLGAKTVTAAGALPSGWKAAFRSAL
jgi:uncharacterized protein